MRQTDEQKWKALADQYRKTAQDLPFGLERDHLLRKARQLETAAHGSAWANSPGLRRPTRQAVTYEIRDGRMVPKKAG